MDMTSMNVNIGCTVGLEVLRSVTGLFMCPVCFYESERLNDVQRHMVTHSNEPPKYKCEICGHRMHQKSNMKSHLAAHEGDRPQKCPDSWIDDAGVVSRCHAAFTDPSALSKHRTRNHGKGHAAAAGQGGVRARDLRAHYRPAGAQPARVYEEDSEGEDEDEGEGEGEEERGCGEVRAWRRVFFRDGRVLFPAGTLDSAPYRFAPSPDLKRIELPLIASIGTFESVPSVKREHVASLSFDAPEADASLLFNNAGFGISSSGGYSSTSFDGANMDYSFGSMSSRFGCSLNAPALFAAPAPVSGWQQHLQQQQLQPQNFPDVMDEPNFLLSSQVPTQYLNAPMDFVVPTGGDFSAPSGFSAGPSVPPRATGWGMSEWHLGFANPLMVTAAPIAAPTNTNLCSYMSVGAVPVKSTVGMTISLGAGTSTRTFMDAGVCLPPAPLSSDVPALPPMDPLCGQPSMGWDAYYGPGALSGSPSGGSSNASSPSTMGMTFDDFLRYAA